ncbi:MAG TPA: ferritin-like domain-containing protein [Gemmatimonadaceae bacterium]|jgi:ferritin-like metal-binding protein YciE|nr:ferritin-like domain-containing protein [Gemmatimonadaceae bacterium]
MATQESLQKLYINELRDLMSAEHMILKALPKMADKASHSGLKDAFRMHEQQTRQHVQRLEQIFSMIGTPPEEKKCKGMEGIIDEGQDTLKEYHDSDVLDAALIAAAQRVEHYEIAAYGCVRTYANVLGLSRQEELLQQTLNEEGTTDHRLTQLADEVVNVDALKAT